VANRRSTRALPKFVDVCGVRVKILHRSETRDKELHNCWGYFKRETATIVVDKDCTGSFAFSVLHHELAHAFLHYSGALFTIGAVLNIQDEKLFEFVEEVLIRTAMTPHSMCCSRWAVSK
jgi:hypothetical protein